jgi:ribosomal protein S7
MNINNDTLIRDINNAMLTDGKWEEVAINLNIPIRQALEIYVKSEGQHPVEVFGFIKPNESFGLF